MAANLTMGELNTQNVWRRQDMAIRTKARGAVEVGELEEHTSRVLRRVHENHETIDVTDRGAVVARLVPMPSSTHRKTLDEIWEERTELAKDIGARWPKGLSAADAISDDRE